MKRIAYSGTDRTYYFIAYAVITLLTLSVLYPMVYILSASFSASSMVSAGKVWLLPIKPTLYNYQTVFQYKNVFVGYGNTIVYTTVGTLIAVSLSLICAYPLTRVSLPGHRFFALFFLFTMIFHAGMIPNYLLIRDLGLMNTRWAVILPGALNIYNMIVARSFMQSTIPSELFEASRIDGCDDFMYFFRVVLPLSKPIIAVISLYYAVQYWNSYFSAFLYLVDMKKYPLQLFLREILLLSNFAGTEDMEPELQALMRGLGDTLKYAVIVISTVPLMMFYPFAQKYLVKGVMIGAVKG